MQKIEQEVVINFNAAEDTADIYTADPVWIRKMDKLVEAHPGTFQMVKEDYYKGKVVSKRYRFPKKLVFVRSKVKKQNLTEEQRKERAERFKRNSSIDK